MLYTIILMASFHLRVLFSPPLLMDIFIPSFNHTIFLSFVFYAFLLFNFFFFLAMFSSAPQWADFEFNFLWLFFGHCLYLFALLLSELFLCPSFCDFPVPFIKTLRIFTPWTLSQSYFCLLLLHRKRKLVRFHYPKSMMVSKLFNYQ